MPVRIPWVAAPAWLREDRTEILLRTRRPKPSAESDWKARVHALSVAVKGLPEGDVRDKASAEMKAMFGDRSRWLSQQDIAHRRYQTEDETKMLWCEMRAIEVRGRLKSECGHAGICWVCGSKIPTRPSKDGSREIQMRQFWCSDACVTTWTTNHEWSAASSAALARDKAICQRCGYRANYVCSGYGHDAGLPWPCPDHPHPAHRRAVPSEAEPGVCGRCREAWPCAAVLRASRTDAPPAGDHMLPRILRNADIPDTRPGSDYRLTGHWQLVRPRGMEINHKIPRAGRGYDQGCHHHLADLETLCHPCHVVVTTAQIRERKGIRVPVPPAPSSLRLDEATT